MLEQYDDWPYLSVAITSRALWELSRPASDMPWVLTADRGALQPHTAKSYETTREIDDLIAGTVIAFG